MWDKWYSDHAGLRVAEFLEFLTSASTPRLFLLLLDAESLLSLTRSQPARRSPSLKHLHRQDAVHHIILLFLLFYPPLPRRHSPRSPPTHPPNPLLPTPIPPILPPPLPPAHPPHLPTKHLLNRPPRPPTQRRRPQLLGLQRLPQHQPQLHRLLRLLLLPQRHRRPDRLGPDQRRRLLAIWRLLPGDQSRGDVADGPQRGDGGECRACADGGGEPEYLDVSADVGGEGRGGPGGWDCAVDGARWEGVVRVSEGEEGAGGGFLVVVDLYERKRGGDAGPVRRCGDYSAVCAV